MSDPLHRGKRIDTGEWIEGLLIVIDDVDYSIAVRDGDGAVFVGRAYKIDPDSLQEVFSDAPVSSLEQE